MHDDSAAIPLKLEPHAEADASPHRGSRARLVVGISAFSAACAAASYLLLGFAGDQLRTTAHEAFAETSTRASSDYESYRDALADAGRETAKSQLLVDAAISLGATSDALRLDELVDDANTQNSDFAAAIGPLPSAPKVEHGEVRPFWISFAESMSLATSASQLHEHAQHSRSAVDALATITTQLEAERETSYAAAASLATQALDAAPSATFETRVALRHAIAQEGPEWLNAPNSAEGYNALQSAVQAATASHQAQEARKLNPGLAVELEIEAFARSLANGVALDFSFVEVTVAGHSSHDSYAGTAEYFFEDGGWAKIELTHSVREDWGNRDAEALVVHEVGHTQVVRDACWPIFSGPVFEQNDESWATAWAIAKGWDELGAGIEAYGRPSDQQIAEAARCL